MIKKFFRIILNILVNLVIQFFFLVSSSENYKKDVSSTNN